MNISNKTQLAQPFEPAARDQKEQRASLLAIAGPLLGLRTELADAPLLIGRSLDADLSIPTAQASREHCRVVRTMEGYYVEDLGSTNKTFVNDSAVTRKTLSDGDLIRIGDCVLKFFAPGSVEADYQKHLIDLAVTDGLTGLQNRRQFVTTLDRTVIEAKQSAQPVSVILADLDHFKSVNDKYGHPAGDAVLRTTSARIKSRLPKLAFPGRLGGEEFAVCLPGANLDQARAFAEVLRAAIEAEPMDATGTMISVTGSFGCACLGAELQEPTDLLRVADERLYEAKRSGRNRVV